MPERFQTRLIPVKPSEEGELEEEAEWVFEHAFVKSPISKQVIIVECVWIIGSLFIRINVEELGMGQGMRLIHVRSD